MPQSVSPPPRPANLNGSPPAVQNAPRPLPMPVHTDEVEEIMGEIPGWISRWGIGLFFVVFLVLLAISWFVKYPDVVSARFQLTTSSPPLDVFAQTSGPIRFLVRDNQAVRRGQYLAFFETDARPADIRELERWLAASQTELQRPTKQVLSSLSSNLVLGTLQPVYLTALNQLAEYRNFIELKGYAQKADAARELITHYQQLNRQLTTQSKLLGEELGLVEADFLRTQRLERAGTVAAVERERAEQALLQKRQASQASLSTITSNEIQISQRQSQVQELAIAAAREDSQLRLRANEAVQQLANELKAWTRRYVVVAPIDGEVVFSAYRSDQQFIESGKLVLTVVPESTSLYCQVTVPALGPGKVVAGQRVNLKFDSYPPQQYGMLRGEVQAISPIVRDDAYRVTIRLPQGLRTTYNKQLKFQQGMGGQAEILTSDLRLAERVFNQFKYALDVTQ